MVYSFSSAGYYFDGTADDLSGGFRNPGLDVVNDIQTLSVASFPAVVFQKASAVSAVVFNLY